MDRENLHHLDTLFNVFVVVKKVIKPMNVLNPNHLHHGINHMEDIKEPPGEIMVEEDQGLEEEIKDRMSLPDPEELIHRCKHEWRH
jgi:hypothetical protein